MITGRYVPYDTTDWDYRYRLIKRLLVLRKEVPCRIGPILTEGGNYWVCGSPADPLASVDPHGQKQPFPLDRLYRLVQELEASPDLVWTDAVNSPFFIRKGPESETNSSYLVAKSA